MSRGLLRTAAGLALATATAVAAPAGAHQIPGASACTPPKDPPSGAADVSKNVKHLGQVGGEAGDMAAGGRLVGRYFYMSGASHFSIYDTARPESPKLVSRVDFGCRFENEDIAVDGRSLIYSDFSLTRELYVYDVRDPAKPKLLTSLGGAGRHTMNCVLDCRYLFGSYRTDDLGAPLSGGSVIDLADPAKPKQLGDWTANGVLPSRKVHDVNEVAPGIIVAASAPIQVMDVRENPVKPKVLGRSPDATKRYHSVEWPRGGKDRWMLSMYETNATQRCEAGVGDFTVFDATGVGNSGEIKPVSSYFLQNGNDAKSQGNPPANSGLGCSPHWFQVRPSWHDGGSLAMASYDHGVKFLNVDGKGAISEIGHFRAPGTNAAAAYWINCDVVYVVDYTRGLDVVKLDHAPTACPAEEVPAPALPQGETDSGSGTGTTARPGTAPSAAACAGRTDPNVKARRPKLRGARLFVSGTAVSGQCGGRIARVQVVVAQRLGKKGCKFLRANGSLSLRMACRAAGAPRLNARGAERWTLETARRLPRGRYVAWVRAVDAFGNRGPLRRVR